MRINARWFATGATAFTLAVTPLIAGFEGLRNTPYADTGGVTTVCFGHTNAIGTEKIVNKQYTDEECTRLLALDAAKARSTMQDSIGNAKLTFNQEAAFTDFVYNAGPGNFTKIAAQIRSGDIMGACRRMLLYNMAGGQVLKGLVVRRQAEYEVCSGNKTPEQVYNERGVYLVK